MPVLPLAGFDGNSLFSDFEGEDLDGDICFVFVGDDGNVLIGEVVADLLGTVAVAGIAALPFHP